MRDKKGDILEKIDVHLYWDSSVRHIIDFKARGHESVTFLNTVNSLFSQVNGKKGVYWFPISVSVYCTTYFIYSATKYNLLCLR